jgi:RNA polymerase sigma factor (sigma-70 family)
MRAEDLREVLARDRRRYERLVYGRLRGAVCWQDAEDIVSEALMRAHTSAEVDLPHLGKEQAWFARIVFNQGIDFLRARDGRRRDGAKPRPDVVSLNELETVGVELSDDGGHAGTTDAWIEGLDIEIERAQAQEIVDRVLARMAPKDAELIKLRHLLEANASRDEVAAMAGLTLGEFRWRYTRAWARFVEAISSEQPTERCHDIRALIGALHASAAPPSAASQIDAHVLDCPSCRVFARDSYRALELLPFIPAIGVAERWSARLAAIWDRSGPEAVAGGGAAAGAGTGAAGLAGAGGAAGGLKTLAAVCGATAVTAGVCGGVLVTKDGRDPEPRERRTVVAEKKPQRTNASVPSAPASSTPPALRPASTTRRASTSTKPESALPSSAASGSREFGPSGSGSSPKPAPAPSTGGGEFGP